MKYSEKSFSRKVLAGSERHELAALFASIYVKEQLKLAGKIDEMLCCRAFYRFFPASLINSITNEHLFEIL